MRVQLKFLNVIFTSLALAISSVANAGLIFNIERISDTEGVLSASGAIDIDVSNTIDGLWFALLSENNNGPITVIDQNLMLGEDAFKAIRFRSPFQVLLRMQDSYELGDVISGQLHFSLSKGVLLNIGSSTPLYSNDLSGEIYGTVNYIAPREVKVSEPLSLAIFSLGIIGLASRRLKKQY